VAENGNGKGRTFQKIWFDGAEVRLEWAGPDGSASQAVRWKCKDLPLGKFRDALQAFQPYAVQLLGLPKTWLGCQVRALSMTEKEDGTRGLKVTLVRAIPAARGQNVTIITPHLDSAPEGHTGQMRGYLTSEVRELIDTIEEYAEEYHGGARERQLMIEEDNENARNADEAMAAASRSATRKPRKRGDGTVKKGSFRQTDIEDDGEE